MKPRQRRRKAEHREWTALRRYVTVLSRRRAFHLATNGHINFEWYGILLPLSHDGSEAYILQWQKDSRSSFIQQVSGRQVVVVEDLYQRRRILRRAIAVVKKACALVLRKPEGVVEKWRDNICAACQKPLYQHALNESGFIAFCPQNSGVPRPIFNA